ncbi:MAG: site-specific integrase [Pseudonocardiales bacterium]
MTTTIPSTDIVVSVEPLFTEGERIALAGFLAGYSGLTRDAYALDLRVFTAWCQQHGLHLFQARRADFECFGRDMETRGRARATISRRLCTITGFYRYAVEEELLEHSPAFHVRRPRLDYESHAIGLDRNEVGSLLVAAGLGASNEHALISLLGINGLRNSEALGADIDALGIERGHRTLTVVRKGGKVVTIPLARPVPLRPPTWRSESASTDRSSCDRTVSEWTAIAQAGSCEELLVVPDAVVRFRSPRVWRRQMISETVPHHSTRSRRGCSIFVSVDQDHFKTARAVHPFDAVQFDIAGCARSADPCLYGSWTEAVNGVRD